MSCLTSRGQFDIQITWTQERAGKNRNPSDFAQTRLNCSDKVHDATYKILCPGSKLFASIDQIDIQITWAPMVKSSEKSRPLRFRSKPSETVLIRPTRHRVKYYAGAVSRLASRGQTGFQTTRAPMRKARKNRETSDFVQTW